jgi:DNA-binding NarL/FixJ family response regulator
MPDATAKLQKTGATIEFMPDGRIQITLDSRMVFEAIGNPLTVREIEILKLVREGKANKEIANRLNIGLRTVKFHVSNLLKALDKHSRGEL